MGNAQSGEAGSDGCASSAAEAIGSHIAIANRMFRIEKQLGEGGFAYVFKVVEEATTKPFALKRILAGDNETGKLAEQEISIMKQCTSRNIINYKGHTVITRPRRGGHRAPVEYLILMEFCPGGTLTQFLADQQDVPLSELTALSIAIDVANAVRVLHTQMPPICHRDLKLDNVLLGQDRVWRLCDFGSATTRVKAYETKEEITLEEELIQQYTTPSYRAPEMANLWQRRVVGPKADIWALGCILYTLVYLKHPFQNGTNARAVFPATTTASPAFIDLIRAMLTENPEARPNILDVTEYLSKIQNNERPHLPKSRKTAAPTVKEAASRRPPKTTAPSTPSKTDGATRHRKKKESSSSPSSSSSSSESEEEASASHSKPKKQQADDDHNNNKDLWSSMATPVRSRPPQPQPAATDDLLKLLDPLPLTAAPVVPTRPPARPTQSSAPATDWVLF